MANCGDIGVTFPPADKAKDLARNWKLIHQEICAIQQAILDAVSQCSEEGGKFCTIVKETTPMTFIAGITSVVVVDGGSGYDGLTVGTDILDGNGTGVGAVTETIVTAGVVTEVNVLEQGFNYSENTIGIVRYSPEMVPGPAQAQVSVNVRVNTYGTDPSEYYMVLIGQSDNSVIQDQMDSVLSYFRNLGYTITAQVNPDTMNTIQWAICW